MKIVGCDSHTRYQQAAMLDTETGELIERRRVARPALYITNNPEAGAPSGLPLAGWVLTIPFLLQRRQTFENPDQTSPLACFRPQRWRR